MNAEENEDIESVTRRKEPVLWNLAIIILVSGGVGMASALGLILGISLAAMLICVVSYVLIKWHQGGWCRQSSTFIFNLDKFRHPKSVELELAPPFTISSSLGNPSASGYVQFHDCNM